MVDLKTPPDLETCYVLMCGYENQIKVIIGVLEELEGRLTYDQLQSGGLQKVGERIVGVKTDDYIQKQRDTALNSLEEMEKEGFPDQWKPYNPKNESTRPEEGGYLIWMTGGTKDIGWAEELLIGGPDLAGWSDGKWCCRGKIIDRVTHYVKITSPND